ncbi:biosynthetic-type acetolactate synthase large subunit [Clostridia bacterium]|nr:biosynthetic-type acetolactate synthase large subunit [Clostridia bacterium]
MKMKAAESLMKILEDQGVEVIFGYPGGAVLPLYDAILKNDNIEHVLVRNEQAAPHAASGYARMKNRTGVCLATSGPGATNLVTGLATAYMDSVPIVAITGQVSTPMIGTDAFQEVDITGITMPITKHNYLVKDANELPRIIAEAFHVASTGRPGPVLVDIPRDVADTMIEHPDEIVVNIKGYKPTYKGHNSQIKKIVKALGKASKPLILAGGGMQYAGAGKELLQFAECIDAPVVTTLNAISVFPETNERALGMLGMHGRPAANYAVSHCDLLISLGARFGDRATGSVAKFAKQAKIIHIDIDPAEIGKNVRADVPIVGDVKIILKDLNDAMTQQEHAPWSKQVAEWKQTHPMQDQYGNEADLKPQKIIEKLGELTRDRAVVTTDVGQHQMWTALHYGFVKERSFITSGGLGTMGYGLPAAIGVQMADPKQLVICITGDGSFQMNLPEMATAIEHCLPIKILLMNNSSLSLVKQLQHFQCGKRYSGIDFTANPDFCMLAQAYGAKTFRIETEEEMEDKLKQALASPGLTLIECIVSNEEMVFPFVPGKKGLDEMVSFNEVD